MNREVQTDELSDELLDAEIPCKGIRCDHMQRSCAKPAVLRSLGHGCGTAVKCLACWQIWYVHTLELIMRHGRMRCTWCRASFITVESFADFRPF